MVYWCVTLLQYFVDVYSLTGVKAITVPDEKKAITFTVAAVLDTPVVTEIAHDTPFSSSVRFGSYAEHLLPTSAFSVRLATVILAYPSDPPEQRRLG